MPRLDRQQVRRFQRRLLRWYARHGRDLPWRHTRDPYRILVSEVMLQQTQVERVIGYYGRFLQKYPTIESLAESTEPQVREAWDGLGYYARAQPSPHRAAGYRRVGRQAATRCAADPVPSGNRPLHGRRRAQLRVRQGRRDPRHQCGTRAQPRLRRTPARFKDALHDAAVEDRRGGHTRWSSRPLQSGHHGPRRDYLPRTHAALPTLPGAGTVPQRHTSQQRRRAPATPVVMDSRGLPRTSAVPTRAAESSTPRAHPGSRIPHAAQ